MTQSVSTCKRSRTNTAIRSAIRFLENRGFSRKQIAHQIGYATQASIDKVMSEPDRVLGSHEMLNLFAACAEMEFYSPLYMSGLVGGQHSIHEAAEPDLNGTIDDDLCEDVDAFGHARALYKKGEYLSARQYLVRALQACYTGIAECDAHLTFATARIPRIQMDLAFSGDGR